MATASMGTLLGRRYCVKIYILTILLVTLANTVCADDCIIEGYNATILKSFNPWLSTGKNNSVTYQINVCEAATLTNTDTDCPKNTAVCEQVTGKHPVSVGNATNYNSTKESEDGEVILFMRGEACPSMPREFLTTIIYFKCGKTLGSPVYLGRFECAIYFEWESHVFCKETTSKHEVPCYVQRNGDRFDLSPLTKLKGAYLVDTTQNRKFYINVCRDITSTDTADPASKCPPGSGACRILNGKGEDMGQVTGRLQETADGKLMLLYEASVIPNGCIDKPRTTINFVCPHRGEGKDPLLIEDRLCDNVIEWETEYACAEKLLTSKHCTLTQEQHNVDIDLSPLQQPATHGYTVNVTSEGESYSYKINVCASLNINCPAIRDNAAVCQLKPQQSSYSRNLGKSDHMQLRLSDGELTLMYKDGSKCHTDFRRNTIITFKCNRNAANGGQGAPVFREEQDCTYLFDWETKYACENHPAQGSCRVDYQNQRYDLSALVRETGDNWVALDGENQYERNRYYINICHDVLTSADTTGCTSTSVCMKDSAGKAKSLGQFTQAPTYNPLTKVIQINYTNGESCAGGRTISSRITFICQLGQLETGPVLIQESDDHCMYEFEWHTAAACGLTKKTGSDCKVFDDDAGYTFDLSRLKKPTGQFYSTNDDQHQYTFLLNVCGAVTGTDCDSGHTNTAVCQVSTDKKVTHKLGEPSTQLIYFDGMINLTYPNGDKYNDPAKTPRQAEIAFLCDPTAGAGHPQYVSEGNYTYTFKWYTSYACPNQPVECVYIDKEHNQQYDLSRLSMSDTQANWVVLDQSHPEKKRKFYINVCRPVNPVHLISGGSCGPFAAICESEIVNQQETVVHGSLGVAKESISSDSGNLKLKYTSGDSCVDENGKQTNYTTTIHFGCEHGAVNSPPLPPVKMSACEYSVIWRTEAACPVDYVESGQEDCRVKDPNSDFVYNLKPLMKKSEGFYEVTSSDKTRKFRLNICGNVSTSQCDKLSPDNVKSSVCEVQPNRKPAIGTYSGKLEYSDDGQLTLTYGGKRLTSGDLVQVVISFVCRRDIAVENPEFVRQQGQVYYFKFETALACPPQPVDCVAIDKSGNKYDLTALAKTASNWLVTDTRDGHSDLKYYINVCRPINPILSANCPGGPVGGCQVGQNSFSLGYVQSKPIAAEDGSVTLRYRGGSLCHKGTDKESHRSTRINFICAHAESDPVFMGETESCEYLFEWNTPSACPQHRVVGSSCRVTDPVYNYQFDLSSLRNTSTDYKVVVDGYAYLINVCGGLVSGTGDCAGGVGACQTKLTDATFVVNAGVGNDRIAYDAGELTLTYTDGKSNCHHKYNRTTIITFTCDHSQDGRQGPRYLQEGADCTYQFEWSTSYACPPYKMSDCTVTRADGKVYDLSPLARSNDNYVHNEESRQKKFILNVCQTVVHQKGQTCPPNSAACMVDLAEKRPEKRFHKIGELSNNPVKIKDNALIIQYDNGEKCAVSDKTVSTIIIMTCDPEAYDTEPSGFFMANSCEYHFLWTTRVACPKGELAEHTKGGNCTATHPETGYTFNLNSLRKPEGYKFSDGNDHDFFINVCGPLANSPCGNNVGSCQVETTGENRTFNSGNVNSNLEYRGGFLMLNYTGGTICHHKYHRATIINFICEEGIGTERPLLLRETDDCVYYFNWYTHLVCESQVLCSVEVPSSDGGYTVDLSPLIKATGHYVAVDMAASSGGTITSYHINVCRPLNPIKGILCPPGSSSCMIEKDKTPVSLGQVSKGPYVNSVTGKVMLKYDQGSKCDSDPSKNKTSRIIFTCKVGISLGQPKFEALVDGCEYVFIWYTNLACHGNEKEKENPSCTYTDPRTDHVYDLSVLSSPVRALVPFSGQYTLQPCGPIKSTKPGCKGAASCYFNKNKYMSYGDASTGVFQMQSKELLSLKFSGGSQCTDTKTSEKMNATTEIVFSCDRKAGHGEPRYIPSSQCKIMFRWKTSVTCPPVVDDCTLRTADTVYDLEILSRETGSWNYTDSDGNIYYINICQGVHGQARGEGCPLDSGVCRKAKNSVGTDSLGSVGTQTLKMDDDGATILLEYSHGATACSTDRRRSNNPMARTIIKFKCGDVVGGPRFVKKHESNEECLFEFEWKTRIACKQNNDIQEKNVTNGVIVDGKSKGVIDLTKLMKSHRSYQVYEKTEKDLFYAISLEGKLQLDSSTKAKQCEGAVVCQEKKGGDFFKNLGSYDSRKYYVKDDQLEIVVTSPDYCIGSHSHRKAKKVSSTFIFTCDRLKNVSEPTLTYMSRGCFYLFNWVTDAVCITPAVELQTPLPAGTHTGKHGLSSPDGSGGVKPKTVGIIISVFLSAIVLCVALVVFHKPERRTAFAIRMKRLFRCSQQTERHFSYSILSQTDEDPEVDDFFMDHDNDVTTLPNTSTDTSIQTTAQVRNYHDDSDDDLLE